MSRRKRKLFSRIFIHPEKRRLNNWILIVVGSIAMFLLFEGHLVRSGIVVDRSMLPTLTEGNSYLVNKYLYHFTDPKRGEIVTFRVRPFDPDQTIKRVIALEGDTIRFARGQVSLNGKLLEEPYAQGKTYSRTEQFTIGPGLCFVLGDNRPESQDSRHFGPIPTKKIEGKIRAERWFTFR